MFKFEKLEIWELANQYADKIYDLTQTFPKEETYNLTDQLRRAANSIPTNIAEGSGGFSVKDFCNYLNIAIKSTYETVSLLYRARLRNYISEEKRRNLYNEAEVLVRKTIAFRRSINKNGRF